MYSYQWAFKLAQFPEAFNQPDWIQHTMIKIIMI